jgi:hypothetical protein
MKSFKEVFPAEDYNEAAYGWRKITELETMFTQASQDSNEDFFYLCLIVDGLWWRCSEAERFYKGKNYKQYLEVLEELRQLVRNKPTDGQDTEWKNAIQKKQNQVESYEEEMNEIERKLRGDLDLWHDEKLPRSFAEYCGLKRLKCYNGKVATRKKILELRKIAEGMLQFAPFYYPLLGRLKLFEITDKVVLVPKILETDADSREQSLDGLSLDLGYAQELAEFLDTHNVADIKGYIEADKTERKRKREDMDRKAKENRKKKAIPPHRIYPRFDQQLMAGDEVLLSREDWWAIKEDTKSLEEVKAILHKFSKPAMREARPEEGPSRMITEPVIDDDKLQALQDALSEYMRENKRQKEIASKPAGEVAETPKRKGYDTKCLFADELWASMPEDDSNERLD